MAQTDSSEYTPPLYDAKFNWRAAVFALLSCGRYFGVADAKAVISNKGGKLELVGHIIKTISALYLACSGGYFFGYIAGRSPSDMPYDTEFNWRAAAFAVLSYGRYFGGADTKNLIDQCISQQGGDGKCGVQVVNIVLALYLSCSAGYFFAFLIAPFAREQATKLSRRTVANVVLLYAICVGVYGDVIDVIKCISEEGNGGKCAGQAIKTVSALLLTYFVPLIVGDFVNILTIVSRILKIISRVLIAAASRLEAIATNLRAASRKANEKTG